MRLAVKIARIRFFIVPATAFLLVLSYARSHGEVQSASSHKTVKKHRNEWLKAVSKKLSIYDADQTEDKFVQSLEGGGSVVYTIQPALQSYAQRVLSWASAIAGAVVVVEVSSGRILTMAQERSDKFDESATDVFFDAGFPAASLFKVVTAAALLKKDGFDPKRRVCYHGGMRKITVLNLQDDPDRDSRCATLAEGVGMSINTVFAKLADRYLSVTELENMGKRFGFGKRIRLFYSREPQVSTMNIPSERVDFARTAAGFWNVFISPVHAALIAQAIANGGVMLRPFVVERVRGKDGEVLWEAKTRKLIRCIDGLTAVSISKMMVETVRRGTARKSFYTEGGKPYIKGVDVAGKTGSLARKNPFRFYSWFIGFAPYNRPQIAISALLVNEMKWKAKGATVARKVLWKYFKLQASKSGRNRSNDRSNPAGR